MADFWYNVAAKRLADGDLDLNAPADIRVLALTTDAEDRDHANLAAIISAGGVEGAWGGYARQALANDATSQDDTNDRAEYDADDITWSSVSSATIVAIVIYLHIDGTNANDIPVAHVDSGGFPIVANGGDITVQWNAEGILQLSTV